MIIEIDDCRGCDPCIGCGRKYRKYKRMVCDICGKEIDEAYLVNGDHVCEDCLPDMFEKIRVEDLNE